MALAVWPVTLPYIPRTEGFSRAAHHKPNAVFDPEDGPTIMRVQSLTKIKKLPMKLVFDSVEYPIFETFIEETCHNGTDHFMMPVALIGSTFVTRRVYLDNGDWTDEPSGEYDDYGLEKWACLFTLNVYKLA